MLQGIRQRHLPAAQQHQQQRNYNKKLYRNTTKRLILAIKDTFWEYTKKTRVSGIWLLRRKRTYGVSRFLWTAVLFALFLLGLYLSLQLWFKFYSYPILNTIASDLSITDVPFPGVTICSPHVVNKERVERFVKTLKIPEKYNKSEVIAGFDYINAYTVQNWIPPENVTCNATDEVLKYNNYTIYDAAMQVSAGCSDFAKRCFWGTTEFPCRQKHEYLSFMPTSSFLGPCCSFNYNPRNESFVPFAANIFGINGGLTLIGVEGAEGNISSGLIVFVNHPMDFVTEASTSVTITANSESFIAVLPTVQSSSVEVLELSQSKRDCLISEDLNFNNYRQAACLLNCQTKTIFEKCDCYPYNLPTMKNYEHKECKLKNSLCFAKIYEYIKSIKCDACLPNCYDVTYNSAAYITDLQLHNYSVSPVYTFVNSTNNTFIIRVYMAKQSVPSVRKITVMSWISLLSDLGGVFSLCLGLSMISVVEFFYYCTHRLHVNYKARGILMQPQQKH